MAKKRSKETQPAPTPSSLEWRSHPVFVASSSVAATFLLCLAIFTQVVAPAQIAKIEIELIKAREANEKLTKDADESAEKLNELTAKIIEQSNEINALREKSRTLQKELTDSRAGNIFTPNNPYPNGLGLVRIGMRRAEITEHFSELEIKTDPDKPDIVTVSLINSPFEKVIYFLSDKTETATINHISFSMPLFNKRYSDDMLFNKLIDAFGAPSKESTKTAFMWQIGGAYSLFSYRKDGYVLMRYGDEPIFWNQR